MRWYGKLLGFVMGFALTRNLLGGLIGLLIGHAFDSDVFKPAQDNPYRDFGLNEDASDAEIDQAYRRLISQCHPDKLAGAAPELQRQAEAKARELNAVYDRIKKMRRR